MARVIVIAGASGSLGRYISEALFADTRFKLVAISRQGSPWLDNHKIEVLQTDYSEESVLSILDSTNSAALISCLDCPGDSYGEIHRGFLNACERSKTCKRFIPSEYAGNIDDYPLLPSTYATTREPFRKVLRESSGVEWTLVEVGWLMDYFIPQGKTYVRHYEGLFPIDPVNWRACIYATGDELQTWTCAREIGKAIVELLKAPEWEPVTYVAGEWSTFNVAVKLMEEVYGRPMPMTHRSPGTIGAHPKDSFEYMIACNDQWSITGGAALPQEKTLRQRTKYFSNMKFSTLEEVLRRSQKADFI
ncbi:MAG: hypothetical protein MMC33_000947 [Icmadophila ericetorum]|nr:hypothetical protein [Icmadophila ericetorum]